ncbi:PH domain-containing protein [Oenococcus sicerae]|uniref:PH domain-containing protein n=1 Tax=Oenococcus sicerae TaxID=2203724 RepID=A0AAJ1RCG4_9LACO|nr:PH domain-containing protein [Oenococcus sicerae]MDN6900207.1 hypothetical protein [Oenococcus sicerae]QAS69789.1 PH domain-containing protein [Oenococcus sicerae]
MNQTHKLPARIKITWLISALGNLCLLVIINIAIFFASRFWHLPAFIIYLVAALTLVAAFINFLSIPYRYRFWQYTITENAVEMQSGFVFRQRIAIPITRVQNVTLSAGPILQWQKLQKVTVATASTQHDIDGLEPITAEKLRDQIMDLAVEVQDDKS